MPAVSSGAFGVLAAGVLAAALIDIRTRRIPNELTAAMAVTGLALAGAGISGVPFWASLGGLAIGLALMMPGHLLGGTGAGDVKLMAGVGAIVGPGIVVSAFLFSAAAGGALAVLVAARRGRLGRTVGGTARILRGGAEARQGIRAADPASRFAYGPAIAAGSVIAALVG